MGFDTDSVPSVHVLVTLLGLFPYVGFVLRPVAGGSFAVPGLPSTMKREEVKR